jgi:hypothetical protein
MTHKPEPMTPEQIHSAWAGVKSPSLTTGIREFASAIEAARDAQWEEATKQLREALEAMYAQGERLGWRVHPKWQPVMEKARAAMKGTT